MFPSVKRGPVTVPKVTEFQKRPTVREEKCSRYEGAIIRNVSTRGITVRYVRKTVTTSTNYALVSYTDQKKKLKKKKKKKKEKKKELQYF